MFKQKTIHNLAFTKFRSPTLLGFIKDIVEVRGHAVETTKRLYPRNTPEILINLAQPIRGNVRGKTAVIEQCTIQGSKTEFVNAWHPRNCHFISIRFTPNGYYKLLGVPQKSFTDHVLQLEDIMDRELEALISTLQEAPTTIKRFQILKKWLQSIEPKTNHNSQLISDFILNQFNRKPGLTVKQLTDKTGFTRKHLVQRFKEEAGLTIKQYQKIHRIYRVLKEIDNTDQISWARIACQYGFYDQSHFIRDFKRYTGFTPSDYLKSRNIPEKHRKLSCR
ncbi:helix-turn-helix domain-containing protein [Halalkalibaculum sp. DA3122]|uniref:helix-turn-helix domain-containing protein n=1 Tax=unclassified Halalkalibaculum TaxID=2964617 RepID=UPI003754E255